MPRSMQENITVILEKEKQSILVHWYALPNTISELLKLGLQKFETTISA